MGMDKQDLVSIGLGEKEAEIYIALLRHGKCTVTELTKKTGIHRTYIYDVLQKLGAKGLASHVTEDYRQYFRAAEPMMLKEYLLEKIATADRVMPELTKIADAVKEDSKIEIFRGKEGIKTILNGLLKERGDYCVVGALLEFEKRLPSFVAQLLRRLDKAGMKGRVIISEGEKIMEAKGDKIRKLPKEYIMLNSLLIYKDKVALFFWEEPYTQILIKNSNMAKSYATHFNILWKTAK